MSETLPIYRRVNLFDGNEPSSCSFATLGEAALWIRQTISDHYFLTYGEDIAWTDIRIIEAPGHAPGEVAVQESTMTNVNGELIGGRVFAHITETPFKRLSETYVFTTLLRRLGGEKNA